MLGVGMSLFPSEVAARAGPLCKSRANPSDSRGDQRTTSHDCGNFVDPRKKTKEHMRRHAAACTAILMESNKDLR